LLNPAYGNAMQTRVVSEGFLGEALFLAQILYAFR